MPLPQLQYIWQETLWINLGSRQFHLLLSIPKMGFLHSNAPQGSVALPINKKAKGWSIILNTWHPTFA